MMRGNYLKLDSFGLKAIVLIENKQTNTSPKKTVSELPVVRVFVVGHSIDFQTPHHYQNGKNRVLIRFHIKEVR